MTDSLHIVDEPCREDGPRVSTKPSSTVRVFPSDKARLTQLDAIRGLAALSVFVGHALGMLPQQPTVLEWIQFTPLHFFYDGEAAVLLFFVLSGFVLNRKYVSREALGSSWASSFIIRRIFRIYPAFLTGVLLSLPLNHAFQNAHPTGAFSEWFSFYWRSTISLHDLLRLLTLVGPGIQPDLLNPPIWSLIVEMRVSLLFPILILVVNPRRSPLLDAGLLAATYLACLPLCRTFAFGYVPQFLLGAILAKYFASLRDKVRSLTVISKAILLLVAVTLYETAAVAHRYQIVDPHIRYIIGQVVGLGAALLILAGATYRSIEVILDGRVFRFLGRTSYSFYLVHFVVLLAVAQPIYQAFHSFALVWVTALVMAYAISDLMFRLVELPMIGWGARAAGWYASTFSRVLGRDRSGRAR